jgi:hypothetical protein
MLGVRITGRNKKKSRAERIQEAVDKLNKAMQVEEPDIQISLPWPMDDNEQGREFIKCIKTFIEAYKKYFGLKKIDVHLLV